MAARRADVLILTVYIFCAFFTIKKASFITEDGISYTFGLDPVYKLNQESYYYPTLWLYKRNCVFARKATPRNVMFLLLLVAGDIESCPGPKYTYIHPTKSYYILLHPTTSYLHSTTSYYILLHSTTFYLRCHPRDHKR